MTTKTVAGFFSGTGGIELGLQQAGFAPVYSNEFDKYAGETHVLNFGEEHFQLEDINNVDFTLLPNPNMIVGGFPCQAFSIGGYRKGFDDEKGRGNLFFKIAEAVETQQPEIILLENVKHLVTHDKGNTFKVILETLTQLGYHTKWKILNAKNYGNIPQGRERVYIISFKDKQTADRFEFPEEIPLTTNVKDFIDYKNKVADKYYYTPTKNAKMWTVLSAGVTDPDIVYQWRRQYVRANKSNVCPTLVANMGLGGHNVPIILTKHGIRKLTPRECFNLMGYPSDYKLPDQSDSRLYKQAGNAVVVPVIKRLGEAIMKATTSHNQQT